MSKKPNIMHSIAWGQKVTFSVPLSQALGDNIAAAIMVSHVCFWLFEATYQPKKKYAEIGGKTFLIVPLSEWLSMGLTEKRWRNARTVLTLSGFWFEENFGYPSQKVYSVDLLALEDFLGKSQLRPKGRTADGYAQKAGAVLPFGQVQIRPKGRTAPIVFNNSIIDSSLDSENQPKKIENEQPQPQSIAALRKSQPKPTTSQGAEISPTINLVEAVEACIGWCKENRATLEAWANLARCEPKLIGEDLSATVLACLAHHTAIEGTHYALRSKEALIDFFGKKFPLWLANEKKLRWAGQRQGAAQKPNLSIPTNYTNQNTFT